MVIEHLSSDSAFIDCNFFDPILKIELWWHVSQNKMSNAVEWKLSLIIFLIEKYFVYDDELCQ